MMIAVAKKKQRSEKGLGWNRSFVVFGNNTLWLLLAFLGTCIAPCMAQSQAAAHEIGESGVQRTETPSKAQLPDRRSLGTISGEVVDEAGSALVGVQVGLTRQDPFLSQEIVTDDDGRFSFANVTPGPFEIAITAEGFSTQTISGSLHSGESYTAPQAVLTIASQKMQITVSAGFAPVEVAEFQIQDQEKQRVLGVIPNFYVSYVPNAIALTPKQKFELAWKSSVDPFTLVGTAALAGIEQAGDEFNGYGQGMQGYAKRYGASYGDIGIGTVLGSAVLPSVLKQDPRYFYKGTGGTRSRILYALASPFICKGDNGNWQGNYSYVAGNLAAAGISNLYYPANDRNGVGAVFGTAFVRFGENALSAVLQEFVVRKLTPHLPASER